MVEVRAIAVEPTDEADRRLRACSLSAYRSTGAGIGEKSDQR